MKKISVLLLLVLGLTVSYAQTQQLVLGSSVSPQTGCNFELYDSGGPNGNYYANQDDHIVIHSNMASQAAVKVAIPLDAL